MNAQPELEFLASSDHERCSSPFYRKRFPFSIGKFQRVRGLNGRYYCNETHASAAYLVPGDWHEKAL
jgi:hypothetical protein